MLGTDCGFCHDLSSDTCLVFSAMQDNMFQSEFDMVDWESKLVCYISMMETM